MTCNDCLYYDVCPLGLAIQGKTGVCLKFKNKSDFVEVVRCKKCKRYSTEFQMCLRSSGITNAKPDDFCSYGERREGEK